MISTRSKIFAQAYGRRLLSTAVSIKKDFENPPGWDEVLPYENIPGPKSLPMIGNLWRFFIGDFSLAQDFLQLHTKLRSKFGDIVCYRDLGGMSDTIYLFSTEEIEKVYRNEGKWPLRSFFPSLTIYRKTRKKLFGKVGTLFTDNGEKWHNFRSIINPVLMQPRVEEQYISSMNSVANDFIDRIDHLMTLNPQGEMPKDFNNELNKWAFESIGVIALDRRFGCLDKNPNAEAELIVTNMIQMFKLIRKLDYTQIGKFYAKFNMKLWKEFVKNQDYFMHILSKYLDEADKKIAASNFNKPENEKSVFEKLLQKDKTIAIVTILDVLTGGIDTTGKVIAAALYFLAKYPETQQKLRDELLKVLPNKDSPVTKTVLVNAPYLSAVLKETRRLSPITSANVRRSAKKMVISGYQIPPGVNIVMANLYLSLQESNFKKPAEFIPERWFRSGEYSYKNVNPFASLPYGFGPRSCVGRRLANMELEILTAKIIRNFILEWPHADMRFGQELIYGIKDPLKLHVKTF